MNIRQLNEFPIVDFLEREGILPAKKRGRSWWYVSPVRTPERTPSFKVDTAINRWYDHGIGEGGKLFDLALRLYRTCDVKAVIQALSNHISLPIVNFPAPRHEPSTPLITIEQVRPLGFHQALVHYLKSRGIDFNVAQMYCKDVTFRLNRRQYFAIGFQNRSGGFELRNTFFKGSSAPKDVTVIKNNSQSLNVTEGFMDFLTLITDRLTDPKSDFLILNSLSFVSKSFSILKDYPRINLFLNNDKSGINATNSIKAEFEMVKDHSALYKGYKDLNEHHNKTKYLQISESEISKRKRGTML